MNTATASRITLCQVEEIPLGLGRPFEVDGKPIALFRTRNGKFFAIDGICPHRGALLADGMLAGDQVVCPYHAFKFHGETGECDQPGVCSLQTYRVEVTDGKVNVTL